MIRRIFCVLLITLGAGLDTYFYIFRFLADGTALFVAIAAALALEILLAFSVWNAQKSKIFTAFAVAITFYAVVQTSAGQTFALLMRDATAGDTSKTAAVLVVEERKNLDRLETEYGIITKQLSSIQTVEARADYAGTIGRMTARLETLSKERLASSEKIMKLSKDTGNQEIDRIKKMSIYDFYASMPGWKGMDWLKFSFHTFLSILLALMTPVGILTWEARSAARILKKSALTKREVDEWVTRCFKKISLGIRDTIMSEKAFYDWIERDNVVVSPGVYQDCARRALALGLITREGRAIITDEEIIKNKIYGGK